jgi:hypothetical protein
MSSLFVQYVQCQPINQKKTVNISGHAYDMNFLLTFRGLWLFLINVLAQDQVGCISPMKMLMRISKWEVKKTF